MLDTGLADPDDANAPVAGLHRAPSRSRPSGRSTGPCSSWTRCRAMPCPWLVVTPC